MVDVAASFAAAAAALALAATAASAQPNKQPFSEGLLWRVSMAGVKDSFVFGTIHVADPRVTALARPVAEALAQSRTLATEQSADAIVDARVLELEQLGDGGRLEPLIGAAAFARARVQLAAQEVPAPVIERLKPWAVMVKLRWVAPGGEERTLDQQLLGLAHGRGMRIEQLEWLEEQIAAFDAIPMASQIALLKHALEHADSLAAEAELTIAAWRRGDLAELAHAVDRIDGRFPGMAYHYRQLTKHIVNDRTVVMHHRLILPLREGRVFVAVGALHLYGDQGLLAALSRDGYRVTRVW